MKATEVLKCGMCGHERLGASYQRDDFIGGTSDFAKEAIEELKTPTEYPLGPMSCADQKHVGVFKFVGFRITPT